MRAALEREEGRVRHAYQDHLGFWTIGVGRMIDKRKGGGLSEDEIDYLLNSDIKKFYDGLTAALPWFRALDATRQRALVNMAFQLGVAGLLKFKTTLAMIEMENYAAAADNALKSLWAKQTPARARRVTEMLRTGVDQQ